MAGAIDGIGGGFAAMIGGGGGNFAAGGGNVGADGLTSIGVVTA